MVRNKILDMLTALIGGEMQSANSALSEILTSKSKSLISESYDDYDDSDFVDYDPADDDDRETEERDEPENGVATVGPYTIKFKYNDKVTYKLGRQLYAQTMTDPAEYADDEATGFASHNGAMDVSVVSITSGGENVEVPDDFDYFPVYFNDEDNTVDLESLMDDVEVGDEYSGEFSRFATENKQELVRSIAQAINDNRKRQSEGFV